MVNAANATRSQVREGSSIWPKTRAVFSTSPDSVISRRGRCPHGCAHPHRHAAEVLRDAADHLLDKHGFADTGTAEQSDLATLDVRGE